MSVSAYALCSLADVKNYLGIEGAVSTKDNLIESLIDSCSTFIESYCQRQFKSRSRVEYYSGDGHSNKLIPKYYPIISITSIYDDTSRGYGADYLMDPDDYTVLDNRIIAFGTGVFSFGYNNIKLTYIAGYATIPFDLKQAAIELVAMKVREGEIGGILGLTSKSDQQGFSFTYKDIDILQSVKVVLDKYVSL